MATGEWPELLNEGPNSYSYAGNIPTLFSDPAGLAIPVVVVGVLALGSSMQWAHAPTDENDFPEFTREPPGEAQACQVALGIMVGGAAGRSGYTTLRAGIGAAPRTSFLNPRHIPQSMVLAVKGQAPLSSVPCWTRVTSSIRYFRAAVGVGSSHPARLPNLKRAWFALFGGKPPGGAVPRFNP